MSNPHSDSSDHSDDLFQIGGRKIITQPQQQCYIEIHSESQQKEKHKKIKKEKKKEKKQKKGKKEKKHKKQRKQVKEVSDQDCIYEKQEQNNGLQMVNPMGQLQQRQIALYQKYEKQLTIQLQKQENVTEKDFILNFKVSDRALPIDVIRFATPQIAMYGLKDRDIPLYKRPNQLKSIIGLRKKAHKMKKIIKQLNKKTNQLQKNWEKIQNESYDRYFHFEGYQSMQLTRIQRFHIITQQDNRYVNKPTIAFQLPAGCTKIQTHEQKIRIINKQYNLALNQNPKNVSLWKKFISIQQKLFYLTLTATSTSMDKDQQYKNALNDRKQSILSKALSHNPNNLDLSLINLQLLMEANQQRKLIQDKIRQLIQVHSESWPLWKFYLQFKLSNFLEFSHTRLIKDYDEIMQFLMENRVAQAKSGKEVWRIRKCGLLLTAKVLQVIRMQGYAQLSTAICSALIEFNILFPDNCLQLEHQERLKIFQQYWENHSNYKLGQIIGAPQCYQNGKGYAKSPSSGRFIKDGIRNVLKGSEKKVQDLLNWMPSHLNHDSERIQNDPRSFILFEDISPFLQIFRTEENLQLLTDMFLDNLGLPYLYGNPINSHNSLGISEFNLEWLQNSLMVQCSKFLMYHKNSLSVWGKYWHPELTKQVLTQKKCVKLIYGMNVLQTLRVYYKKSSNEQYDKLKSSLLQYLLFIYGAVFYLEKGPDLLKNYMNREQARTKMQQILAEQPTNSNLWALYIEIQSMSGKSNAQCIACFVQWIHALPQFYAQSDHLMFAKLQVAYWLATYIKRIPFMRSNSISSAILYCLRILILDTHKHQQQLSQNILDYLNSPTIKSGATEMEILLMGNQLMQILKNLSKNSGDLHMTKYKCYVYYFLLQMGQNPQPIIDNLLKSQSEIGLNILIDFNLLTLQNITKSGLLASSTVLNNIKFMQYLNSLLMQNCSTLPFFNKFFFKQHCQTIKTPIKMGTNDDYVQDENQNLIYMWLMAMRTYQTFYLHNMPEYTLYFMDYFLKIGRKKIVSPMHISQQPFPMIILNKLLSDPDYSLYCLDRLPYCKNLYHIAILNPSFGNKLQALALQKQIRVRNNEGIAHEKL